MHRLRPYLGGLAVWVLLLSVGDANATVIRKNTSGSSFSVTGYWGHSVVIPSGGPWDNLTFNFYSDASPAVTPHAFGTLFLLSQDYFGTADALSAATTGYIANSTSISGGKFVFPTNVTIQPNTTYFFYQDGTSSGNITGNAPSGVAGEFHSFISDSDSAYTGATSSGSNFSLEGTAIPEPTTLALAAIALLGIGCRCRKQA
jgi:hypothetical protein